MGIISGVVKKDEDPVEGAKVYILYDGEVVASAETNEDGEYACYDLDEDKKYHAVVEHSEVDGEEVTHYSARSMPGITPAEDPRLFLYKDGEGGENWDVYDDDTQYCYIDFGVSFITMNAETWSTAVGGSEVRITIKEVVDLTPYNYFKIRCNHDDFSIYLSLPVNPWHLRTNMPFAEVDGAYVVDISQITGDYTVMVDVECDDYESNALEVYRIWLE